MADAIKVAQQRREDYKKAISEKEKEIEELKEMIADLDSFIEFGEALVNDGGAKMPEAPKDAAPKPVQQQPTVVKSVDPDDEWGNENEQQGIARVLAARNG
ncbi:MAG: hypothetical protein LJE62_14515 [Silicimonas sp.]|jgi:hypothetical protein|nr:hypothetical protein [Silicimonas sp.]